MSLNVIQDIDETWNHKYIHAQFRNATIMYTYLILFCTHLAQGRDDNRFQSWYTFGTKFHLYINKRIIINKTLVIQDFLTWLCHNDSLQTFLLSHVRSIINIASFRNRNKLIWLAISVSHDKNKSDASLSATSRETVVLNVKAWN